jgi:hypothetical protein
VKITEVDGVVRYTFRQSGIKNALFCLERGRRDWFTELESQENDATTLGSALHVYAEERVQGIEPPRAVDAARNYLTQRVEANDFEWVKIKTPATLFSYLTAMMETFESEILPKVGPFASVEHKFLVKLDGNQSPVDASGNSRMGVEIWLEGQWDFEDANGTIWDWKTAGSLDAYQPWEIDRFHIQPTVYTAAQKALAGWDPLGDLTPRGTFEYGVVSKGKSPIANTFRTTRGPDDWRWLAKKLWSFVTLYEGLGAHGVTWPLNDQGWWCSEKWCPAWPTCKGAR